ncbi:MAG: hypothetical protein ABR537_05450 [Gemmatimonadales bacterium]
MSAFRVAVAALVAGWGVACGGGLEPQPICGPSLVGICGTLRFHGMVPDSTDNVFLAAYATFPQSCSDLINDRRPVIPGAIPYSDSVAAYSVELPPDTYRWVVAVWKKVGALTLTPADTALLRVADYFRDPADTSQPGAVTVPSGGSAGNVNFRVEFDSLRPATDFVTCAAK